MARIFYSLVLSLTLLSLAVGAFGEGQPSVSDKWPDYVAGEYDIRPNITYSIANNTELKLDLYLPKNRAVRSPTLILFHGGGWVDGQKERNVLFLLPYLSLIVNWFGITDVAELLDGPNAKHYAMEWFGSMDNRKELAQQVSPLSYVRAGLPPIITIHGDQDDVVPYEQAVRLHAALEKVGVPNQLVTIRGRKHGGFNRQELIDSLATTREFLRKNRILPTQ